MGDGVGGVFKIDKGAKMIRKILFLAAALSTLWGVAKMLEVTLWSGFDIYSERVK